MVVGLIGYGKMGKIHLKTLESLKKEGLIDKIRVYDVMWEYANLVDVPNEVGLKAWVDFDLFVEGLDKVIVASPTDTHLKYVKLFRYYNIPVLCEKPFIYLVDGVDSVDDSLGISEFVTDDFLVNSLMVGYVERFNKVINVLYDKLVHATVCDKDVVLNVDVLRVNSVVKEDLRADNIVHDLGVHDIDILNQLFSKVEVVDGVGVIDDGKLVHVNGRLTLDGSIPCNLFLSWVAAEKKREITVMLEKSVIKADLINQTVVVWNRVTGRQESTSVKMEPIYAQDKEFILNRGSVKFRDPYGLHTQWLAWDLNNKLRITRRK
jgi:predicted dehydrogenase